MKSGLCISSLLGNLNLKYYILPIKWSHVTVVFVSMKKLDIFNANIKCNGKYIKYNGIY